MIAGVGRSVGSGAPRLPRKLVPQQPTSPLLHSAQLCDHPVDTLATPSRHAASRPATGTGGEIRCVAEVDDRGAWLAPQPIAITAVGVIHKYLSGLIETMISVMARSAYPLNTRVQKTRRRSVLRQISIVVLVGLSACSSPAAGPRLGQDRSKTTELGLFMKTRINPSFSKISFLLFHDEDSDTEVDPAALPASANELASAAEKLSKWTSLPGESEQSKQVFDEYAESLKTD